ncbi:pentatricopeptide repeat-containing protein At1g80270, mitochondrial [Typha angustifolia]|uniref:pentatricopeptide repeat-containing protein At1g80270, mitochondrial n=1 Tax=Typha angustifolia TaxID=59011 RepID=UPI003C2EC6F2
MWALRRAANPLRSHSQQMVGVRACCAMSEVLSTNITHREEHHEKKYERLNIYHLSKSFSCGLISHSSSFLSIRKLSCQAGAKSSDKEDGLEDGFSDLEVPPETDIVGNVENNDDSEKLLSEGEISEEDIDQAAHSSVDLLDAESDLKCEKKSSKKQEINSLFKVLMDAPRHSMAVALEKWVGEGNELGRSEFYGAVLNLRKRKLYAKALQFMEWLEATKQLDFNERDYASRLDLVAKIYGLQRAENYIEKIPESLRGEVVYRTLLANCAVTDDVSRAQEVFNKMRNLGFPVTAFACNQLLLLYKRCDRKKIADVLLMMEKENVKPSIFTYRLLVDVKGSVNDISGMEQILETMKAEGVEPDLRIQALVARHYILAGHKDKAEATLKEMEGYDINENRFACKYLLPLYASLGKADEVGRIWKACEEHPRLEEYLAVIESFGSLGEIESAEKMFENMLKTWKKLSPKYYNVLLKVYAKNKLLHKGKELVKRMSDNGCMIGPITSDALVKLYVEAGEVEKADSIMHKLSQQNNFKPLYTTCITLLDNYARRGDIHNSEKIFQSLRQNGYSGRLKQYQSLLQAYINAKTPAYGFRERMKADNMFPNKHMAAQLATVDAFRKTKISDLLD